VADAVGKDRTVRATSGEQMENHLGAASRKMSKRAGVVLRYRNRMMVVVQQVLRTSL